MMLVLSAVLAGVALPTPSRDADQHGFGGAPLLGAKDSLRQLLNPYDLVKLHVLGANYCENLLDVRLNVTSYTHLASDSTTGDAWHLHFHDDAARYLEGVAWEDQYSPVTRLELARRLVKGILAARLPGTYSDSAFRHRSGGKTFLIFGDSGAPGRLTVSMWGDELSGSLKVGFRTRAAGGEWQPMSAFTHSDPPDAVTTPGEARSARHWNESPATVRRHFTSAQGDVGFTGRYWLSDEDKPLEYAFAAGADRQVQVVVGEPGCPLPLLGDYRLPTTIHLPDRATTYRSDKDGDRTFERPSFHYLVLRKTGGAWGATAYSAALLVMWEGQPERVEVIADKGYGEVRVTYAGPTGKVWLNPYYWLDDVDLDSVFRSADHFLAKGTLLQNGFPTQQLLNAIPVGLAAGACMLTRWHDPLAQTARLNAARAVDRLFAAEDEGKKLARSFFPARAAAWMAKAARAAGDVALEARCAGLLDRAMARMCSTESGYDGKAWGDGWTHFNCAKTCWLAYDATGKREYLDAFERALGVYTIDAQGIYRYGKKMDAPGGFETYSGSLPLGVWGNAGKLDWVRQLIDLDVPNGWNDPKRPVKETWNDAGAGPWAQDDANPEYVGICLRGAKLPTTPKTLVPVGAFPSFDDAGRVTPRNPGILHSPTFLPGVGSVKVVKGPGRGPIVRTQALVPGTDEEQAHLVQAAGTLDDGRRSCTASDGPLVYRFGLGSATGAALDLRIQGDGYRVEVSPDGKRWIPRLDTWDRQAADQSLDVSFLTGSREELVRLWTVQAPDDAPLVHSAGDSLVRDGRRHAAPGGAFVYRFDLPLTVDGHLEVLAGNGYRIEISADGKTWQKGIAWNDPDGCPGVAGPDGTVVRLLDVTPLLKHSRRVYVRVADDAGATEFAGHTAYVQRLALYAAFRSRQAWVRLTEVSGAPAGSFTLERVALRTWRE